MSETRFTPGPWEYTHDEDGHQIYGHEQVNGYMVSYVVPIPVFGMTPANAHLIASAPELYEALAEFEYQLGGETDAVKKRFADVKTKARAVLAKARGKQS